MVQAPIFLSKEAIKGKIWSSYRGRRAGRQVKEREIYKCHYISTIERPRYENRGSPELHRTQKNISNCKVIRLDVSPGSKSAFVPSFLLSNDMSLVPEMDELRVVICNANFCFASITETWLKDHIDDNIVSISGYNIIRRDRKGIDHGGICMYVRDSIRFKVLHDFMNDEFEVLWMQMWPERLPRGIQSITVGTVYHPPSACKLLMRNYLYESMSKIEAQFSNCGVNLLDDFNKLDLSRIANAFGVKQVVPFPTRGQSKLDLFLPISTRFMTCPISCHRLGSLIMPQPWKCKSYLPKRSYCNRGT